MMRRRFNSNYQDVPDGIYAVKQNGRMIPVSSADSSCIGVALVAQGHRFMIEKFGESNQSYKTASEGKDSDSAFHWGGHGTDQPGIITYKYAYGSNAFGYIKSESDSYGGTPHFPDNASSWTSGALSDWNGKSNSEVLKGVTTSSGSNTSYATIGHVLNTFLVSPDAKGFGDWYIPSLPQLALIYMHLTSINNALSAIGGRQFNTSGVYSIYWSNSEYNSQYGWTIAFNTGIVSGYVKPSSYPVRFIRDI